MQRTPTRGVGLARFQVIVPPYHSISFDSLNGQYVVRNDRNREEVSRGDTPEEAVAPWTEGKHAD